MANNAVAELDKLDGSMLDVDGAMQSYTRGAFITGIQSAGDDADILYQAAQADGMPSLNSPLTPALSGLLFTKLRVYPLGNGQARGYLTYETPRGFLPSSYLITNRGFLQSRRTSLIPGSRTPIRTGGITGDPGSDTADDLVIDIMFPCREITVSMISLGTINATAKPSQIGMVNNAPWQGFDIGYWLLTDYQTDVAKWQGWYSISARALTRCVEDWSEVGRQRSSITGRYAALADSDVSDINQASYSYGIIYNATGKGTVRFGPFRTTSFPAIFGF